MPIVKVHGVFPSSCK